MDQLIGDEELDRQLRDAALYIDDDGFTSRVVQQLPAQSNPLRLRAVILTLTAILASVLVYFASGGGRFLFKYSEQLAQLPMLWLLLLAFTAGILVAGFGLVAALFKSREPILISR
jgi:hypothetical protein